MTDKNQEKKIFKGGRFSGSKIFKYISILIILIGINAIMRQSRIINELSMHQALEIFVRIDDIAHQEIIENAEENPFNEAQKEAFYKIDKEYHRINDMHQKYLVSKQMIDLLMEAEKNRAALAEDKNSDMERDDEYQELLKQFRSIE